MKLDDQVCLCFHVTRRKVINFIKVEKPSRASQLSECFGAGTGCGWCRPFLERILKAETGQLSVQDQTNSAARGTQSETKNWEQLSEIEYTRQRARYVREGGGTPPPGATPID